LLEALDEIAQATTQQSPNASSSGTTEQAA
jgi:hypothetical protein